jgi:GntR family transcriptional repressor for pyruvate dehydrogenase complex
MERLSARIAGELEAEILAGKLPKEERLPSEEKLCARFDASRTVIREAIQQLRGRGLLRTQKGSGTYLADPSLESLGSAVETYSILVEKADFLELMDFRILVESECARLAAEVAGNHAITEIRQAIAQMKAGQGSRSRFSKADISFHMAIALACPNRIYATLLGALEKRCIEFAQANRGDDDWYAGVINQHQAVLEAIELGRGEQAAEAMRRHLLSSRRHYVDLKE